ncbi:uncharacterized protein BT62DRAFT_925550 [Guyanagaster necrorhizus]|uniref:Uncharacterized protein n=1 Tax=Guyanagaster necrorhizus TaxID=856835 RepID=A0A9P7W5J5_9AGAR|nr:uncharacterized protein BT62DRAFT_925550 [Guyanagaster necrorhizus MCA 3950]KAG7453002.1 hypothetical protein BT62DRAFT_925550 [Guyanagaster necrorhizus MCA 3950]
MYSGSWVLFSGTHHLAIPRFSRQDRGYDTGILPERTRYSETLIIRSYHIPVSSSLSTTSL